MANGDCQHFKALMDKFTVVRNAFPTHWQNSECFEMAAHLEICSDCWNKFNDKSAEVGDLLVNDFNNELEEAAKSLVQSLWKEKNERSDEKAEQIAEEIADKLGLEKPLDFQGSRGGCAGHVDVTATVSVFVGVDFLSVGIRDDKCSCFEKYGKIRNSVEDLLPDLKYAIKTGEIRKHGPRSTTWWFPNE